VIESLPPDANVLSAEAVRRASAEMDLQLSQEQADRLVGFAALLAKWNRVHNLTAVDTPSSVLSHHLLDSLSVVPELSRIRAERGLRVLDVGAGGGLPGIPIAIALPSATVTEIDKVQKKTAFLQHVRAELALANVQVVHGRVEDQGPDRYDVIISRAFASLADMVRKTAHLLARDGVWAAMKGVFPAEEIGALPPTAQLVRAVKLRVPLLGAERHLVVLRPR
jgi:16S rRNA (guanine527-N7)-methyltransferase